MAYNGLETVKPTKPIKRGDLHIFPKTTADQIITDETTDKRLTTDLAEKMPKSGGTFTGAVTLKSDPTANLHATTKQYVDSHNDPVLLWTNAKPTSDFAVQTIRLNLSAYKYIYIKFRIQTTDTGAARTTRIVDNNLQKFVCSEVDVNMPAFLRHFEIISGGISFGAGYVSSTGTNVRNDVMLPYQIYGIK